MRKFKVALALGGGGVRGFSHIGVLKVLEENRFPIDLVVGTSMGAIVGAIYCLYKDINLLEEKALEIVNSKEIKGLGGFLAESEPEEKKLLIKRFLDSIRDVYLWYKIRTKKWIVDSKIIRSFISRIIPENKIFSDLKIPFFCVATDILTGEEVIFKEGNLLDAVLASSSIPGIFEPMKIGKRLFVDGGITSLVPSPAAKRSGSDFIIGVNVGGLRLRDDFRSGIDILFR